jgi:transcriptional regulator with XRE-family HTH domain
MGEKHAVDVIAEALAFFVAHSGGHWNQKTIAKEAGVSANTVGNAMNTSRRTTASGKPQSIKVAELDMIAKAMGLSIADLTKDLSASDRLVLMRTRASEFYQRTGTLPPWAPMGQVEQEATPPGAPRKRVGARS